MTSRAAVVSDDSRNPGGSRHDIPENPNPRDDNDNNTNASVPINQNNSNICNEGLAFRRSDSTTAKHETKDDVDTTDNYSDRDDHYRHTRGAANGGSGSGGHSGFHIAGFMSNDPDEVRRNTEILKNIINEKYVCVVTTIVLPIAARARSVGQQVTRYGSAAKSDPRVLVNDARTVGTTAIRYGRAASRRAIGHARAIAEDPQLLKQHGTKIYEQVHKQYQQQSKRNPMMARRVKFMIPLFLCVMFMITRDFQLHTGGGGGAATGTVTYKTSSSSSSNDLEQEAKASAAASALASTFLKSRSHPVPATVSSSWKRCTRNDTPPKSIVLMVWAVEEAPDVRRFEVSLQSIPGDTQVKIYCGSTACIRNAKQALTKVSATFCQDDVHIERLIIPKLAYQTPIQKWTDHHVLAKLLCGSFYEGYLQAAMQIAALYQQLEDPTNVVGSRGDTVITVLQPGVQYATHTKSKAEWFGVCSPSNNDNSVSMLSPEYGFYTITTKTSNIGTTKNLLDEMGNEFLQSFLWDKNILERYSEDNWPIKVDLNTVFSSSINPQTAPETSIVSLDQSGACSTGSGNNNMNTIQHQDGFHSGASNSDGSSNRQYYGTYSYEGRRRDLSTRRKALMNIGDEAQGLAGIQMLPKLDAFMDRDSNKSPEIGILYFDQDKPHLQVPNLSGNKNSTLNMFINAWYGTGIMMWPPPENVNPVTVAMHMQRQVFKTMLEKDKKVSFIKKHQPIGSLDTATQDFLQENKIHSVISACMTMTLFLAPQPTDGSILINDIEKADEKWIKNVLPPEALKKVKWQTQQLDGPLSKSNIGRYLVSYKRLVEFAKAKLIITGQLHVALPSLALGKPVVFLHAGGGGGGDGFAGLDRYMHQIDSSRSKEEVTKEFDFMNPPPAPFLHEFVESTKRIKQLIYCHVDAGGIPDAAIKFGLIPEEWTKMGIHDKDIEKDEEQLLPCPAGKKLSKKDADIVHIATGIDIEKNFELTFPTWLNSLSKAISAEQEIKLYIFVSHSVTDISRKQMCLLRLMAYKLLPPNVNVYFVPDAPGTSEMPSKLSNKLNLPNLLPCVDKVIWIDSHVVVTMVDDGKDVVQKLWDQRTTKSKCGVTAPSSDTSIDITDVVNVFDAGLMLLDLEALRKSKFAEKVATYWGITRGQDSKVTYNLACNGTHSVLNVDSLSMTTAYDLSKVNENATTTFRSVLDMPMMIDGNLVQDSTISLSIA